jgi:CRISPR-associated protein Csb2
MSSFFCVNIRFLGGEFHGRADGGEPEWPPTPLRLFQALVAAASARWRNGVFPDYAKSALSWLERQSAPFVIAPSTTEGTPYRPSVPNNAMDKVARAWMGGNYSNSGDANPATHKSLKTVRPTRLVVKDDESGTLHYLYPVTDCDAEFKKYREILFSATRSITHLGWGVDMVAANATVITEEEAGNLSGERWRPVEDLSAAGYRVPVKGTLDALISRHEAFLNRISRDERGKEFFTPVPPLAAYRIVGYRLATDPLRRPFVAFSLLKPDGHGFRAFDAVRRTMVVAGMMRSVASAVAKTSGWSEQKIANVILGHGEALGEPHRPVEGPRLAYLPVPSIEPRGEGRANVVGAVRRVLVTTFTENCREEIDWAARMLSGGNLVAEQDHEVRAILTRISSKDPMVVRYVRPAATWATVTPVILPGYDDSRGYRRRLREGADSEEQRELLGKLDQRIEHLLRKAIRRDCPTNSRIMLKSNGAAAASGPGLIWPRVTLFQTNFEDFGGCM